MHELRSQMVDLDASEEEDELQQYIGGSHPEVDEEGGYTVMTE